MTQLTSTDKLRSSDLQSNSDLDSIRNSCDVCIGFSHTDLAFDGLQGFSLVD